jgi:hypothetical protein
MESIIRSSSLLAAGPRTLPGTSQIMSCIMCPTDSFFVSLEVGSDATYLDRDLARAPQTPQFSSFPPTCARKSPIGIATPRVYLELLAREFLSLVGKVPSRKLTAQHL